MSRKRANLGAPDDNHSNRIARASKGNCEGRSKAKASGSLAGDHSVEALRRELAEAREQQAATAQVLTAISNSPTDPNRVFAGRLSGLCTARCINQQCL